VKPEVLECEEFGTIDLRIDRFLEAGELKLDDRIASKGLLNISIKEGKLVLRADRYIGLIPLNALLAIRVRPRANIANLSHYIAYSGVAPSAIIGFSKGYLPRFETNATTSRIYAASLIAGCERIAKRGLLKKYEEVSNPPPFRGRLLGSDTVRKYLAKGIRYKHAFSYSTLTEINAENVSLREALKRLLTDLSSNVATKALNHSTRTALAAFSAIPDYTGSTSSLLRDLGRSLAFLPPQLSYYRDPLWTAFMILQKSLPDFDDDGSVSLDSLIVDISKVFEAYARRCLYERAEARGWTIYDGNMKPFDFFFDAVDYKVHPDIIIKADGETVAVVDVKYKPRPKESDRYELLSFMDAAGVKAAAFVCPAVDGEKSRYLGTTSGGKSMSVLRFDLACSDPALEADKLVRNVDRLLKGSRDFE
jgi:5-methylcytosine-specific restriction enzyme subunit McrC